MIYFSKLLVHLVLQKYCQKATHEVYVSVTIHFEAHTEMEFLCLIEKTIFRYCKALIIGAWNALLSYLHRQ